MSCVQDDVRKYYSRNPMKEDKRNTRSRANSMEARHTAMLLEPYITPTAHVVEFGCATGYYAGLWHDQCASYLGVDIVQENVGFFNSKNLSNAKAQLGDATNCPELADNSFDVVLCLGPMYHLPAEERALAMAEMARICKTGGIAAFAYINKVGVMISAMTNRVMPRNVPWYKRRRQSFYPNRAGIDAVFQGVNDFGGPFFFTMPEEVEPLAAQYGLRVLKNAGVDIALNVDQINKMDDEQYACWLEIAAFMLDYPSVTGMANHALLITAKD